MSKRFMEISWPDFMNMLRRRQRAKDAAAPAPSVKESDERVARLLQLAEIKSKSGRR